MGFKLIPWRKRSRAIEMDEINVWLLKFNLSDDKMSVFFGSNFMLFSEKNVFLKNNQRDDRDN